MMWPTIVARTRIDTELVRLLREIRTAADNARRSLGDEVVGAYRQWAGDAYRRLRPHFDDDAMSRLVRRDTFWAVGNTSPTDSPHAKQLVATELGDVIAALGDLMKQYEAFVKRWDDAARVVVLDTSAVMATNGDVATADWYALLDQNPAHLLRLVIPLVVVDELDNLKDRGNNTAKREARHALRALEPLLLCDDPTPLPDVKQDGRGVPLIEPFSDPPTHRRLPSADDEIVRQSAMLRSMTGYKTIVGTRDTGMLIRVRDAQLVGRRIQDL